jgi:hypothetical protein
MKPLTHSGCEERLAPRSDVPWMLPHADDAVSPARDVDGDVSLSEASPVANSRDSSVADGGASDLRLHSGRSGSVSYSYASGRSAASIQSKPEVFDIDRHAQLYMRVNKVIDPCSMEVSPPREPVDIITCEPGSRRISGGWRASIHPGRKLDTARFFRFVDGVHSTEGPNIDHVQAVAVRQHA